MSPADPVPSGDEEGPHAALRTHRYPNLCAAVAAHPGRWGAATLAAAEAAEDVGNLTIPEWTESLDRIEAALRQALASQSCTRVRTPGN